MFHSFSYSINFDQIVDLIYYVALLLVVASIAVMTSNG